MKATRHIEYIVAVASFIAAVAFAFTSLLLDDNNEVAAGNCTVIAQFLLLTASIFGIDYKLNTIRTKNGDTMTDTSTHTNSTSQ